MRAIEDFFNAVFSPFRKARGAVNAAKAIPAGIKGQLGRAKNEAEMYSSAAKGAADKAKGAKDKAGAVKAPAMPKAKMGLFGRKKTCPGCGQKLHPSWDECPYCGFGKADPKAAAAAAPASGGPQRTMAIDLGGGGKPAGDSTIGWLIPLEGQKAYELFQLKGRVTVGSAPDNDVCVPEASISGHHCELIGDPVGFKLNDLGSTNGTFVNDKKITSHDLIDNDNVRLGKIKFKYKSLV